MTPWLASAAVLGAIGVTLGAFGAHGLRDRLTPEQLGSWQTAVEYHLLHSVALLALALYASAAERSIGITAGLWTAGIVLFAGSIYGLVLGGPRWLGPVTPLGGLCLILGWLSLLLFLRR
ncbi:MAG: DUF423 domain-containing protein [Myxococcales bacterium]|nr:DUF423 domain-containing protein [Myxococcales bacterium]